MLSTQDVPCGRWQGRQDGRKSSAGGTPPEKRFRGRDMGKAEIADVETGASVENGVCPA